MSGTTTESSAWSPLRQPVFRALWLASILSTIGTSVHDVGAVWLMTSLAPTPFMVSFVQAASSAPLFLFAVPAGALADIVDRRRLLLFTQSWMLMAAGALAGVTAAGAISPTALLIFTFILGIGSAANAPAWQAITPELVPRTELPAAVTLNGMGTNVSRAIGPALGGLMVAAAGPQAAFALNAVSFAAVLMVLINWKREHRRATLPAERFVAAIRAGGRYARSAIELRTLLARALLFIFPASALWALLPLVARERAGLTALGYGILLGMLGAGAVAAAAVLPRLRAKLPAEMLLAIATLLLALSIAGLAMFTSPIALGSCMLPAGVAWLTTLSSFKTAAQFASASWVKARALAVYLLVFFGGMAAGSLTWGAIANVVGISPALVMAAFLLCLTIGSFRALPIVVPEGFDLTPSTHWPEPAGAEDVAYDRGPVLVTIEYTIAPELLNEFTSLMPALRRSRLRDGAFRWGLFENTAVPDHYVEYFLVESWIEHLRQHERVTENERVIQDRIQRLQGTPPQVTHFIAKDVD